MGRFILNPKSISLVVVFAALAIVLNAIRIPAIFWPNMFFTFAGIPVLISFQLYGFKIGFMVELVHIIGQEIFFPLGAGGVVAYPLGFFAVGFMFIGIYFANKLMSKRANSEKQFDEKKKTILYTVFSGAFRGGLMPIIDSAVFYGILLPIALGIDFPPQYILSLLPSFVIYNLTAGLYNAFISYLVARKTSNYLKINAKYLGDN